MEKAENAATDLTDAETVTCVVAATSAMKFPPHTAGTVTIELPMVLMAAL